MAYLKWATDATYPASADAWSGQPNKVVPPSQWQEEGWTPGVKVPAEYENFILNYLCEEAKLAYQRFAKLWMQDPVGYIGGSGSLPNVRGVAWCKTRKFWIGLANINATNNWNFFPVRRKMTINANSVIDYLILAGDYVSTSVGGMLHALPISDVNGIILGFNSLAIFSYNPDTGAAATEGTLTSRVTSEALYYEPEDRLCHAGVFTSGGTFRFLYQDRNPVGSITTANDFTAVPAYNSADFAKMASNQTNQVICWLHNYIRRSVWESSDGGISWTEHTAAIPVYPGSYAHGYGDYDRENGRYVMPVWDPTNFTTDILTSDDGVTWTLAYTVADKCLVSVCSWKKHLVACGNQKLLGENTDNSSVQYTTSVFVSFDGGETWIEVGLISGDTDQTHARLIKGDDQIVCARIESSTKMRFLPSVVWE